MPIQNLNFDFHSVVGLHQFYIIFQHTTVEESSFGDI